jgi:hypothetical protein
LILGISHAKTAKVFRKERREIKYVTLRSLRFLFTLREIIISIGIK